ncbi:MAG: glycosyltransferase family 39 protein [Anaerolineales bacterium]|nr:glycosyltransferase family 39 protein [Anaerolineales bacterium]
MRLPTLAPNTQPTQLWHRATLAAIIGLAIFLHFFNLDANGYGNLYYAAAVKSMGQSWHNFFYVSFDPGGFVSVDKPPLGLWVQVWATQRLGFSGWAMHLPQALAGVLCVPLTYWLARRYFGPTAGVLAALFLTLTPISIAANRNNTMDAQLVLTSLLAAWAALKAAEAGKLKWFLLSALFIGLGFNIKQLQAFLILPAVLGLYFLFAPTPWLRRILNLALASVLIGVVSLAWGLAVDATPASARPFVGSSTNNTVMELITGHNGTTRLGQIAGAVGLSGGPNNQGQFPPNGQPGQGPNFNPQGGQPPQGPPNDDAGPGRGPNGGGGPMGNETGNASVFRLFNSQLAGQASWLLPLALVSLALLWRKPAAWLWGLWLIPQVIFFSFAGLFHRYYLEMLSPAIAILAGAGLVQIWDVGNRSKWALLAALVGGVAVEIFIVSAFPTWAVWLVPVVSVAALIAAVLIWRNRPAASLAVTVLALLIAPAAWSVTPLISTDVALPFAGPELLQRNGNGQAVFQVRRTQNVEGSTQLTQYLLSQRNGEKWLAATLNANTAAPIILQTGEPVIALGGFSGRDNILTAEQLAQMVSAGDVRFFLMSEQRGPQPPQGNAGNNVPTPPQAENNSLTQWITANCQTVPSNLWQGNSSQPVNTGPGGATQLYDCAP